MNIKTTIALVLLIISSHLHSNENQFVETSEIELMQELELELELLYLIHWECSNDNPFLGKFDSLDCNVMNNNQDN